MTFRWAVNIGRWHPEEAEIDFLLTLIPEPERKDVRAFKFLDDQKRALCSRLLQRQCTCQALRISWQAVSLKRTRGRKPFAAVQGSRSACPNFNFNVSHEGHYVVLAAEPLCVCGIDVAAPQHTRTVGRKLAMTDLRQAFDKQLTSQEWHTVESVGPDEKQLERMFRRLWSLKEAFSKARGDGVGYDFGQVNFSFPHGPWESHCSAQISGIPADRWRFSSQELGDSHWVSVARGPLDAIVDAWGEFTGTMQKPHLEEAQLQEALDQPCPPFELLSISNLVPAERLQDYEAAGGDLM
ncbi:hypothetical protein WJX74_004382 [Apatococcus lobatus]|uniref:holo-[acyl-carrier-protein] synthase n=2 Tax=Apatococcus TaxID=904362 RepID=A0AAW1TA14_9CHLO